MSRSSRRFTGRSTARSAVTGRYVRAATAVRRPRTTVVSRISGGTRGSTRCSGVVRYRSAITGRYASAATAARWPRTTIAARR